MCIWSGLKWKKINLIHIDWSSFQSMLNAHCIFQGDTSSFSIWIRNDPTYYSDDWNLKFIQQRRRHRRLLFKFEILKLNSIHGLKWMESFALLQTGRPLDYLIAHFLPHLFFPSCIVSQFVEVENWKSLSIKQSQLSLRAIGVVLLVVVHILQSTFSRSTMKPENSSQ